MTIDQIERDIAILKDLPDYHRNDDSPKWYAIADAIYALEKNIAKKPIKKIDHIEDFAEYYCPNCSTYLTSECEEEYARCCDHCGQVIDWSEEK